MSKPKNTSQGQELVGQVQLARIRLEQIEGKVLAAKEAARLAKRKKKEAKEQARPGGSRSQGGPGASGRQPEASKTARAQRA
jgi:hypothetical protein